MLTRVSMNRFRKLTNQTMRRDHSRKGSPSPLPPHFTKYKKSEWVCIGRRVPVSPPPDPSYKANPRIDAHFTVK